MPRNKEPEDDMGGSALGDDILDAISSKDPEALLDALRELVYDCVDEDEGSKAGQLKIKIGG